MSNNAGVSASVLSTCDDKNTLGAGTAAARAPSRVTRSAISAGPGHAFMLSDCLKEFASSIAGAAIDLAPLPSASFPIDEGSGVPRDSKLPPQKLDAKALNCLTLLQNEMLEAEALNGLPREELGKLAAHVLCRLPFCEQQKLGSHVLAALSPEALSGLSALFVCSLSDNTFKGLSKYVRGNLSDIAKTAANMREINPSASANFVQSCLFDLNTSGFGYHGS